MSATNETVVRRGLLTEPSDYAIAAVLGIAAIVTVGVWTTGQLAGLLFHATWPAVGLGDGLGIALRIPHHLADPRQAWPDAARGQLPGPVGVYTVGLLVLALGVVGVGYGWRWWHGRQQIRGFASRTQLAKTLSHQAVLAQAGRLRPSLAGSKVTVEQVAVDLGRAGGMPLAASAQNSVLLLAAPRQGKTSQVIIPWLHTWPGPALVTSIRRDVTLNTLTLRQHGGRPVAVMDLSGTRWPHPLRWSPVTDCEWFDKARQRADVMVAVGKNDSSDSTNAGFFGLTATNLLAGWLHAAAITNRSTADVLRWALDERIDEPIKLLRDTPAAADGVASMLDNIYRSPSETRSNLWTTVLTAVAPLLSQVARGTFCPPVGESFNVEAFLRQSGTVYLLVAENQAADLAPLISAFVDEVTETAKRLADTSPADRLDPPLGLILDEVANVVPLPNLPALMSYAGGSGIFVVAVLQDLAQARKRWGRDGADMLWGAATIKIALGGLGGDELDDFSRLAGVYRETVTSPQVGPHGTLLQSNIADRQTITPDQVRTLSEDRREALVIHATTPAVKTRMVRHYESRHAHAYRTAEAKARQLLHHANHRVVAEKTP